MVNQTFPSSNFEIIVVGKINEKFINKIIKEVREKRNIQITYEEVNDESIGVKLHRATEIAKGEIITFLGDYDIFYENKLSVIDKLIRCKENYSFLRHTTDYIDENSRIVMKTDRLSNPIYITDENWLILNFLIMVP